MVRHLSSDLLIEFVKNDQQVAHAESVVSKGNFPNIFSFFIFKKKDWKITDWLIGAAPFAWQSRATSETSAPEVAKLFDTCPVLSWISMAFGIDGTPNTCHLFFVCVAPVQNWRAAWHLIRHKNEQTSGPWRWFTMPALGCTDDRKTKFFFSANHWRPFRCRTSGCAFFRPQPKGVRDGRLQSRHLLHSGCCYLPKREKYLHSDASSGPSVW